MLVLSRRAKERIIVDHKGEKLIIEVSRIELSKVRLGFSGSSSFSIQREELLPKIDEPKKSATAPPSSKQPDAGTDASSAAEGSRE